MTALHRAPDGGLAVRPTRATEVTVGQLWIATACVALGALGVVLVRTSGSFPAIVIGGTLFLGPGMALTCWRRERVSTSWWIVFPTSCATVLLLTRCLLAVGLYRPTPIAVTIAAGVAVAGVARLATERVRAPHGGELSPHAIVATMLGGARAGIGASVRALFSWTNVRSWRAVSAVALVLWFVGCRLTSTDDLTTLGLLGALSPVWYLGVILGAVAVVLAVRASTASDARPLAAVAIVAVLILHGTAPLVYESARYAWTYKHIGFADYFARFHDNDRAAVDIYHAFPAFFSSMGVVAATSTSRALETIARWWPLLIEISTVLVLRRLFERIRVDKRLVGAATVLFVVANWIGQDYLSPQSVALVLALTIFAIVFRQFDRDADSEPAATSPATSTTSHVAAVAAVLACWTAIVVSHPLTPFIVLPGLLVAFPIFRFRPRYLPTVMAAIAFGYVFLQRGIVEEQGVGNGVGNVVANVQSRGTTNGVVPTRVAEFDYYFIASMALSAVLVGLAVIGARTLLRSVGRRRFVGLACQAISPTLFLAVNSYGQEGVLRAFLFASPWLCLSAAMLLARAPRPARRLGSIVRPFVLPLVATAMAALACVAFFVRDLQYAVAGSDVEVVRRFEELEPDGGLLIGTGVLPDRVTASYYRERYVVLAAPQRFTDGTIDTRSTLDLIEGEIETYDRAVYMAFGPSLTNRAIFDGRMSAADLEALQRAIAADARWELVFRDGPSSLYRWQGS